MNREQVFEYVKRQYCTVPDYPWQDNNAVLRHEDNRKWYGLIMEMGRGKLGLSGSGTVDIINVKCDRALIGSLRMRQGFHPAYHMNKDSWVSVQLDGSVGAEEVKNLIDLSFRLTRAKKVG